MRVFKKAYWIIYPALIVLFMLVFDQIYFTNSLLLKMIFSAPVAFILSPRKKIIKTQTGKVKQITWIFFKKPILLNF